MIHMPPPVHGVSVVCKQIFESPVVNYKLEKRFIRLNLSDEINKLRKFSLKKALAFIKMCFQLIFNLVFFRPDLVYFAIMPVGTGFIKDAVLVFIIKLFQRKLVFHLHNRGIPRYYRKPLFHFFYKEVFKNCSIIHLSNKLVKEELNMFNKKVKLHSCPNGIPELDRSRFSVEKKDEFRILFFSNLFMHKGIRTTFESLELIINKNTNLKLVIGGSHTGEFQAFMKEIQYQKPYLLPHIEFHKECFSEKKSKLFFSTDLFILPTEFAEESMPLVILEAMSANLPVIATDTGAISDMVRNEVNGFLIPPGNVKALSEKIDYLIHNPDVRIKMGLNSRELFQKYFTLKQQEMTIRNIFEQELNLKT